MIRSKRFPLAALLLVLPAFAFFSSPPGAPAKLVVKNAFIFSLAPNQHEPFHGYLVVAEDDYEVLHAAMERKGYTRTVAVSGKNAHVPTGTYLIFNLSITVDEALNRAVAAAKETNKSYSIIVTDWTNIRVANLEPVL